MKKIIYLLFVFVIVIGIASLFAYNYYKTNIIRLEEIDKSILEGKDFNNPEDLKGIIEEAKDDSFFPANPRIKIFHNGVEVAYIDHDGNIMGISGWFTNLNATITNSSEFYEKGNRLALNDSLDSYYLTSNPSGYIDTDTNVLTDPSFNATQMENSVGVLNILEPYLNTFSSTIFLRQDGTTPLTGQWNYGGQNFNGSGNFTTSGNIMGITQSELNTLTNDSMADSLHRHSELSASDGTPNPALSVDADGNVGIGTTGPSSKLTIDGDLEFVGTQNIKTSTGDLKIQSGTYDNVLIGNTGSNLFFVDGGTGFVGVGPATPWAKMTIAFANFYGWTNGPHADSRKWGLINNVVVNGDWAIMTGATQTANPTLHRLYINPTGNVGIGTTSPTQKLDVNGIVNISGGNDLYVSDDVFITDDVEIGGDLMIGSSIPASYPLEVRGYNLTDNNLSAWFEGNISATGFITRTSIFDKNKNPFDYIKDSDYFLKESKIDETKFYGYTTWTTIDYSRPEYENEQVTEEVCREETENITQTNEICDYKDDGKGYFDKVCYNETKIVEISKEDCSEEECNYEEIDNGKYQKVCNPICNPLIICKNETKTIIKTIYPYSKTEKGVELGKEIDVLRQGLYELNERVKYLEANWVIK